MRWPTLARPASRAASLRARVGRTGEWTTLLGSAFCALSNLRAGGLGAGPILAERAGRPLSIEQDGIKHNLELRVDREGNSKKLSITVAYSRGGKDIVAPYAFDAKVKKREVLRIEGNLAIAVTVTPTNVAAAKEDKGEDKPKLDLSGDEDDPFAGLD